VLFAGGFTLGSAGLAMLERAMRPGSRRPPVAGGAVLTDLVVAYGGA
jgi:hypothetical protein